MQRSRSTTRYHNIEILSKLGYRQVKNTTVFFDDKRFILSPAVGADADWFDIREVNLKRIGGDFLLLVRMVYNHFILEDSKFVAPLLTETLKDNRPHLGDVWGIRIRDRCMSPFPHASLYNVKNSYDTLSVKLLNEKEMREKFNTLILAR